MVAEEAGVNVCAFKYPRWIKCGGQKGREVRVRVEGSRNKQVKQEGNQEEHEERNLKGPWDQEHDQEQVQQEGKEDEEKGKVGDEVHVCCRKKRKMRGVSRERGRRG